MFLALDDPNRLILSFLLTYLAKNVQINAVYYVYRHKGRWGECKIFTVADQKFCSGGDWVTPNWGKERGKGTRAPSRTKHIIICHYSNCISIPYELRQCMHCLTVLSLAQFPCEWMACLIVRVDNVTHRGVTGHPIHPPGSAPASVLSQ